MNNSAENRRKQLEEPLLRDENEPIHVPILERKKGSPISAKLVLVVEFFERICYYSTLANLLVFCITLLGISNINSLLIVLVFIGFSYFLSLFGCWISDSLIGRYKTILSSIIFYTIGSAGLLAISYFKRKGEVNDVLLFLVPSLVFIAFGAAGIKSNISTFAARQAAPFGEQNVRSVFNWFYWIINVAALISYTLVAYLQIQNFFYGYIPGVSGVFLAAVILAVTRNSYVLKPAVGSYLTDIVRIQFHAFKRRLKFGSSIRSELPENAHLDSLEYAHLMFGGSYSTEQIEIVRCFSRMSLIFSLLTMYWTIYFQMPSTFLLQSHYFDLNISSFQIPAASMNLFDTFSILIIVQLMENCCYPLCQYFNLNFTPLRRIGVGLLLVTLSMVYAGLLEPYRRDQVTGSNTNIIGNTIFNSSSFTVFLQAPQFVLVGFSEFFTSISGLELAYSQSPKSIHNIMMALFLTTSGLGAFLAAIIIKITSVYTNWICEDINDCHLEYYFFFLAGVSTLMLIVFIAVSCCFPYSAAPYNHTMSRDISRTQISRTDISDISDFEENFFEDRASSRIDLSRDPSFEDIPSPSSEGD